MSSNRRDFLAGVIAGMTALGAGCVGLSGGDDPTATATSNGSRSTTATIATASSTSRMDPSATAATSATATTTPTATTATTPAGTTPTNTPTERTRTTETAETADDVPVREPPACDGSVHRLSYPIDEVRYGSLDGFALTASEETVVRGRTITFRLENTTEAEKTTGNERKYDIQRRTDSGWQSIYWVPDQYGYNAVGIMHPPGSGFSWKFPFTRDGLEQPTQFNTPYSVCEPLVPGEYRFVYWGVTSEAERRSDFETESAVGVRFAVEQPGTTTTESG